METHISASLLYALWEQPLGRRTLVRRTAITESTVRTHLNKLRARGWVDFAKAGTTLTGEAKSAFAPLFQSVQGVEQVRLDDLELPPCQVAAHIRVAGAPKAVWRLRDRAIQGGAGGALLLQFNKSLVFPDEQNPLDKASPASNRALLDAFSGLKDGDWVLVAFASTMPAAQRGLWSMVVELLQLKFQS